MPKAKNVTVIPATRNLHTGTPMDAKRRRKVAGYARVSTDSDEQFTSYEAQVDYYTQFIQSNPEWELVEIYTDEGISGLSYKNREGFNRMIADALNGRIDLIVTKSVSRFARNTVDTLTTVRKLKDAGVEVFFQKENIFTLDSNGELLSPLCHLLPRKRAVPFPRTSPGDSEKASQTARSSCRISNFSVTARVRTALPRSFPRRRKSSSAFTAISSPVNPPLPSQKKSKF